MYKDPEKVKQSKKIYNQEYYNNNKVLILQQKKGYYKKNRKLILKKSKEHHKTRINECKMYKEKRNSRIKYNIMSYYNPTNKPECICCGESKIEFLGLDHINGNGFEHRKKLRELGVPIGGNVFYWWLVKNDFPYKNQLQTLCHNCNISKRNKKVCSHNRKIELQTNIVTKRQLRYRKLRNEVLSHYSGNIPYCNCCGENELEFLTIDHIGGNGRNHRKNLKTNEVCWWIKKHNYPKDYQVLCMNCNMVKGSNNKTCPHLKQKFISI